MSQIERELKEIANEALFEMYNPIGHMHIIERHVNIDRKGLKKRLKKVPFDMYGDVQSMSRFSENVSMSNICEMINICLTANEESLRRFLNSSIGNKAADFYMDFNSPIGEGLIKGTDETTLFKMSRLCVVAGHSNKKGRKVEVFTAYPMLNPDEIDDAYDAIDDWQNRKTN